MSTPGGSMGASDAAGGTTGEGEGAGAPQGGQDVSALAEQMQAMQQGQEELRSLLSGLQEQGQNESIAAEPEIDLSFLDEPYGDPADLARNLSEQLGTLTEQQVQSLMAPVQQQLEATQSQLQDFQLERQFDALVTEFSELGDPEVAQELIGMSSQMAQQVGQPELATSPAFMRLVYMSARAADAANAEGNAPAAAHLEGAGGAIPGGGAEVDWGDQIVNAKKGRGVLPF